MVTVAATAKRKRSPRYWAFVVLVVGGSVILLVSGRKETNVPVVVSPVGDVVRQVADTIPAPTPAPASDREAPTPPPTPKPIDVSTLNPSQSQKSAPKSCADYDGVVLIALGPKLAAAGTIFFQYVINQLLYAEQYNLYPWIHMSSTLRFIYDSDVHGGTNVTVELMEGMVISVNDSYPGAPVLAKAPLKPKQYTLDGSGIWNHYFEPIAPVPNNCPNQPLLQFTPEHLKPGFHAYCPYAVRSWRYGDLPQHIKLPQLSYKDWYHPMRQRGRDMVEKYFRFLPELQQAATRALPPSSSSCLAMHVRHSDKKADRRIVTLDEFWPYVQAYQRAAGGNQSIYLATDSTTVLEEVQNKTSHVYSQQDTMRSKDKTAVFKLASHHRTNVEVLVDILALSKCQFFLHGRSAVSEATFYLNLDLHDASVDLEDTDKYTPEEFEAVVRKKLKQ